MQPNSHVLNFTKLRIGFVTIINATLALVSAYLLLQIHAQNKQLIYNFLREFLNFMWIEILN